MTFRDVAALWLVNEKPANDVVLAACDLLVADVGSTAVARLAALSREEADTEVPILLPEALREFGLTARQGFGRGEGRGLASDGRAGAVR